MIVVVFTFSETHSRSLCALIFRYYTWVMTVDDSIPSHTGKKEGGIVSVKQEHEEVKWYSF